MEILYDIIIVITGVAGYKIIHAIVDVVFKISQRVKEDKSGVPRMDNPPLPPNRKSFKERLSHKSLLANHHGYQPTEKMDTSNPPTETGT